MRHHIFHGTLAAVCLVIIAFSVCGVMATGLRVPAGSLTQLAVALAILAAGAWFYGRWRKIERLHDTFVFTFWAAALTNLYVVPMYIAGRSLTASRPFRTVMSSAV